MKKLSFYGFGEIKSTPRWHMPPHRHTNHHELIVVLGGEMRLRAAGGDLQARAGDVLFYAAGLVHEEISAPENPVHTLFFGFTGASPALPLRTFDAAGRVAQLAGWLLADLRRRHDTAETLWAAMIAELRRLQTGPRDLWLEDLSGWLRANYAKKLSLSDIARRAGMSRFAFIRKFKQLTGQTPMAELRRIRLEEARNLLLSTGLPLKSIAPRVGLGDEYRCSKLFRSRFGLSPRQIRARAR